MRKMQRMLAGLSAAMALGCSGAMKAPASGPVVEVQMTGDGTSAAAFEPSALSIAPGTIVRFINVSGGPHNVAFWPDSVPRGGAAALARGMPEQVAPLIGAFLTQANERYDVSFAGPPAGVYQGYCQPHLVFGMRVTITVR